MISVTRLNGEKLWINPHLIEFVEETPDTVISLLTGRKIVVKERIEELTERIILYRRNLWEGGREFVPTEIRGES